MTMFEAFEFGPITIWMRLLFLLFAIWLSTEFFFRLAASAGLSLQNVKEVSRLHFIAFLVGGRILAVVANYQAYAKHWLRVFIIWDGAFSFIGACIGVGIVLFYVTKRQRATFLQWLDVLLPASTFGLSLDWLGMFFAAQSYGKPTDLPWGVVMDTFNVRYTYPIHPVQLYYAFSYIVLTFVLLLVRKNTKRAGAETLFAIVVGSFIVFFFEFMRGDFSIPVFAKLSDFFFLACLFTSLGVLAAIEDRITQRTNTLYSTIVGILTLAYVASRSWIELPQYQLRFSQVLAVLALLATVVYVVVHRRKYPHL